MLSLMDISPWVGRAPHCCARAPAREECPSAEPARGLRLGAVVELWGDVPLPSLHVLFQLGAVQGYVPVAHHLAASMMLVMLLAVQVHVPGRRHRVAHVWVEAVLVEVGVEMLPVHACEL